jgi:hypothetical protein
MGFSMDCLVCVLDTSLHPTTGWRKPRAPLRIFYSSSFFCRGPRGKKKGKRKKGGLRYKVHEAGRELG